MDEKKVRLFMRDMTIVAESGGTKLTFTPDGLTFETRDSVLTVGKRKGPLGVVERFGVTFTKRD